MYEFGPFHLDATRRVLLKEGKPVSSSEGVRHTAGACRAQWRAAGEGRSNAPGLAGSDVEGSNLTTNISHLRKLLGESRDRHNYIVTVPGRGYRFVAGVRQAFDEVIVRERARVTVEEEETENLDLGNVSQPAVRARDHWLHRKNLLLAVGVVVVAALAFGLYRLIRPDSLKSVATVPFTAIKLTKHTNSGRATLAAISPDGRYIVHVLKDAEGESLWLKQVATQSNVQIAPPASVSYWGLTFSPDGEYVYCVTAESNKGDTTLSLIPVLGGPSRRPSVGPHGQASFSPDGRSVAFTDGNQNGSNPDIANAEGNADLQKLWNEFKRQDQQNVDRLKDLIRQEIKKGCF